MSSYGVWKTGARSIHIQDLKKERPNACKNKPRGESPTDEADLTPQGGFFLYRTECKAHRATKACAENFMKLLLCGCTGLDCCKELEAQINSATNRINYFRCDEYGW